MPKFEIISPHPPTLTIIIPPAPSPRTPSRRMYRHLDLSPYMLRHELQIVP